MGDEREYGDVQAEMTEQSSDEGSSQDPAVDGDDEMTPSWNDWAYDGSVGKDQPTDDNDVPDEDNLPSNDDNLPSNESMGSNESSSVPSTGENLPMELLPDENRKG